MGRSGVGAYLTSEMSHAVKAVRIVTMAIAVSMDVVGLKD